MTSRNRSYPDISFVNSDTDTLVNALITSYEKIVCRKLYPADPTRNFILWIADIIIQERILINEAAKQNVPRYAEGIYLDSLAEIFKDTYRLQPKPATVTFRFYLSTVLPYKYLIPVGTRVAVDGNIVFETTENLYIEAGEYSGDVEAVCQTVGEIGNDFVPGQITQLVDVFQYYEKVENITISAGGAELESDDSLYERMRESMETFSTAGAVGAYEYYAKTASTLIADTKVTGPIEEPGVVDIRVLMQDGDLPQAEILRNVLETVSADHVRPLTDFVRIAAPEIVPFDIDVTYFISKPNAASAALITRNIENAVEEYKRWQTERMGRDINPSQLTSFLVAAGAKRIEIRSPVFTAVSETSVAQVQNITVLSGGIENE